MDMYNNSNIIIYIIVELVPIKKTLRTVRVGVTVDKLEVLMNLLNLLDLVSQSR